MLSFCPWLEWSLRRSESPDLGVLKEKSGFWSQREIVIVHNSPATHESFTPFLGCFCVITTVQCWEPWETCYKSFYYNTSGEMMVLGGGGHCFAEKTKNMSGSALLTSLLSLCYLFFFWENSVVHLDSVVFTPALLLLLPLQKVMQWQTCLWVDQIHRDCNWVHALLLVQTHYGPVSSSGLAWSMICSMKINRMEECRASHTHQLLLSALLAKGRMGMEGRGPPWAWPRGHPRILPIYCMIPKKDQMAML